MRLFFDPNLCECTQSSPARLYASVVYSVVESFCARARARVCVCVCVCVTLQYCIKTAKNSIRKIMPNNSAGTVVF